MIRQCPHHDLEADASIHVPEFLCVSAVLEKEGLSPEWLPLLQPQLLRMLATRHLESRVGLHPADLRMVLLPGKIHRIHVNVVLIRRQTDNIWPHSPCCQCRINPTVENVDTFLFKQPDPFVRVFVNHATFTRLGQNDSITFAAHRRCLHQCFVNRCHSEIHAAMRPLFRQYR